MVCLAWAELSNTSVRDLQIYRLLSIMSISNKAHHEVVLPYRFDHRVMLLFNYSYHHVEIGSD